MFDVLIGLVIAFATTYFCLPRVIYIADKKKLFDVPDNRKVHKAPIASLGGVAIFFGVTLACIYCIPFSQAVAFQYYLTAALIIFFLGMQDDILTIAPGKKMLGQMLAALIVIYKGGLVLTNLQGFAGIYNMPLVAGFALTLLIMIAVINAFNLIDGVDGLAGTLGGATSILLGYFFLKNGHYPYAILSFALSGSLLAFLSFNLQPARIFMGDTGSLLVGLICSVLVLKFIQLAPQSKVFQTDASPAVGFSMIMIPLLDTIRVFSIRLWNRQSPFCPDKNHIHHLLLAKGFSHARVTSILLISTLCSVAAACLLSFIGTTMLIFFISGLYFGFVKMICLLTPVRKTQKRIRSHSSNYATENNIPLLASQAKS